MERQIFVIPFHVRKTLQHAVEWDGLNSMPTQAILDRRSELERANVRLGNNVSTFKKTNCDVWADRPTLISYEISSPGKWASSVIRLKPHKQIVHVVPDEKGCKIEYVFYNE